VIQSGTQQYCGIDVLLIKRSRPSYLVKVLRPMMHAR